MILTVGQRARCRFAMCVKSSPTAFPLSCRCPLQSSWSFLPISKDMFFWVKRTLDPHVAKEVSEVLDEEKIPGFHFIEESKRYYPKDNLAAQVIGFVGIDDKGLEGVEASMDTYLRGVKEKQTNYTDAKGNLIGPSGLNEVQIQRKNTVQLTIDARMQFILERGLDDAIKDKGGKRRGNPYGSQYGRNPGDGKPADL